MAQPPWKDALARARRGGGVAAPAAAAAGAPAGPAVLGRRDGLAEAAAVAPGLAPLMAERQALEQRMLGLTGQSPADPRYVVEPLDRRRAAIAAWAGDRDAMRDAARAAARPEQPASPTAAQAAAAAAFQAPSPSAPPLPPPPLRGTAADALRPTPGEQFACVRPRRAAEDFERAVVKRAVEDLPPLRPLGEADAGRERPRRQRGAAPEAASPAPEASRGADAGRSAGQAMLDRRLARARDMAARARRNLISADRALDAAQGAISRDWRQRRLAHVPGLGRDDPYVRETARKLSVAVGSLQEFGEKADRLRGLARDMRELKAADEANDDARRERALERLKARREES